MSNTDKDDLRPEYDLGKLGKGVRGKYFRRYSEGSNVVVIDPDLTEAFPNAKAVNDALRDVLARKAPKRPNKQLQRTVDGIAGAPQARHFIVRSRRAARSSARRR